MEKEFVMQPIRIIYSNLPDILEIPKELKNKKAEIIIWPLEQSDEKKLQKRPFGLAKNDFQIPDSFFDPLPNDILIGFGAL